MKRHLSVGIILAVLVSPLLAQEAILRQVNASKDGVARVVAQFGHHQNVAARFTASDTFYLTSVVFSLEDVNTPSGFLTARLYSNDASNNPGTEIAESTDSLALPITGSFADYAFSFSGVTQLVAGQEYHIGLYSSEINSTHHVRFECSNIGDGDIQMSATGAEGSWVGHDFQTSNPWFELWGTDSPGYSGYAAEVMADNPYIYTRLDETTGSIAIDEVGNHDGNYNSVTLGQSTLLSDDPEGYAIGFTSGVAAEHVDFGDVDALDGLNELTVEFLFKYKNKWDGYWLVSKGSPFSSATSSFWAKIDPNNARVPVFAVRIGGANIEAEGPFPLVVDQVYHFLGRYDGSAVSLWLNGEKIAETPASGSINPLGDKPLNIGYNHTAFDPANGVVIDEVAIYDTALSSSRIQAHYLKSIALIDETFEEAGLPSDGDWSVTQGVISWEATPPMLSPNGGQTFKTTDRNNNALISKSGNEVYFQFYLSGLGNASTEILSIGMSDGNVGILAGSTGSIGVRVDGSTRATALGEIEAGVWYHVKLKVDPGVKASVEFSYDGLFRESGDYYVEYTTDIPSGTFVNTSLRGRRSADMYVDRLIIATGNIHGIDLPTYDHYIALDGADDYISTPDSPANSVTGSFELESGITFADITPVTRDTIFDKYDPASSNRSIRWRLDTNGKLTLILSGDGAAIEVFTSTAKISGSDKAFRVTYDASTFTAKFYTALVSGKPESGDWTQLGSDVPGGAIASIYDNAEQIRLGKTIDDANYLEGEMRYLEFRDGIGGPMVARFNASEGTNPTFDNIGSETAWTTTAEPPDKMEVRPRIYLLPSLMFLP